MSQDNGGGADANGSAHLDASGGGSGSNVVPADASPDANACATGRVVYLNFAGETLAQAATSDATQNEAVWVGMNGGGLTSGTLAQWRPGATDRATQITDVVTGLTTKFAAIAPTITFVTTRPAAGPYVMIGFGGARTDVGVPYTDAVNRLDCGDAATKSDVGWVFEAVDTTEHAITSAAGALAFGMGATGTTDPDDCMCGWLTNCTSSDNPCTFSATADAELDCPNETDPQDDVTLLKTFCN
jgi:hypothetical protein